MSSRAERVVIRIQDVFVGASLRHFADRLFDMIERLDADTVVVDFSDVDYVSRSFAQQYLLRKNKTTARIEERDRSATVERMFSTVSKRKRSDERFDFSEWEIADLSA